MKILALAFLLFGVVAAIPVKDLERAKDEVILSFMMGMEEAPSLREAMDVDFQELDEVEDEIKTELVKSLREKLGELLEKIKDAIGKGNVVKEQWKESVEKIKDELKKLGEGIGTKLKEIAERLKEKVKSKLKEFFDKLINPESKDSEVEYSGDVKEKVHDFLIYLRKKLEEKHRDLEKLKEEVKEKLKEKTELARLIMENLTEKSLERLKRILDILINKKKERRNVKDLYEKIKDYLKEAREDFQKHFSSFMDWLEKVYKSGAEAAKGRVENLKKVLLKFLKHVKEVGKKTADEALEFFRPYKEDLGTLWDELEKSINETYGEHEKHY